MFRLIILPCFDLGLKLSCTVLYMVHIRILAHHKDLLNGLANKN